MENDAMRHKQRNLSASCFVGFLVFLLLTPTRTGRADFILQSSVTSPKTTSLPPIPRVKYPADKPEVLAMMYSFAAEHPEILRYVPCYCSCGKNFGHRSNEDCFVKARNANGSVVWCTHAAECVMCLQLAERARTLYMAGYDVETIRRKIDAEYGSKFKNATTTPEPPSGTRRR